MEYIVLSLWLCLAPAGVLWLCRKNNFLGKIGPVLILYILGIITGNLGLWEPAMKNLQDIYSNAMVPLAIPMMLFGCSFKNNNTSAQIKSLVTGLIAVVISVVAGYFIFGKHIPEGEKVAGMMTGVYTGGTINLAALKTMLGASDETYILMNSYDMIVSFLYLTFLLSVGIKLFRKFLPVDVSLLDKPSDRKGKNAVENLEIEIKNEQQNPYRGLFTTKQGREDLWQSLGLTLLICAVSGALTLLFPDGLFMTIFILSLTTLGIAASFLKKVRNMQYSYDVGMYFIYVFCITVASMADLTKLDFVGGISLLAYLLLVVFGSLILQFIFAKILKIDGDTVIITSVAFINSPPFVPMIAAAMKNRSVLAAGLSIGVLGYAIGNYLGFLIYQIL